MESKDHAGIQIENAVKGRMFEEFVISKFLKPHFTPLRWRSDKYFKEVYAAENRDPDLVIKYSDQQKSRKFAVECKWRSGFRGGVIQIAKQYQLENYFRFMNNEAMRVFLVIGIGGTEHNPAEVYIVPLINLRFNDIELHIDFLRPYKRADSSKPFFFDTHLSILR